MVDNNNFKKLFNLKEGYGRKNRAGSCNLALAIQTVIEEIIKMARS